MSQESRRRVARPTPRLAARRPGAAALAIGLLAWLGASSLRAQTPNDPRGAPPPRPAPTEAPRPVPPPAPPPRPAPTSAPPPRPAPTPEPPRATPAPEPHRYERHASFPVELDWLLLAPAMLEVRKANPTGASSATAGARGGAQSQRVFVYPMDAYLTHKVFTPHVELGALINVVPFGHKIVVPAADQPDRKPSVLGGGLVLGLLPPGWFRANFAFGWAGFGEKTDVEAQATKDEQRNDFVYDARFAAVTLFLTPHGHPGLPWVLRYEKMWVESRWERDTGLSREVEYISFGLSLSTARDR